MGLPLCLGNGHLARPPVNSIGSRGTVGPVVAGGGSAGQGSKGEGWCVFASLGSEVQSCRGSKALDGLESWGSHRRVWLGSRTAARGGGPRGALDVNGFAALPRVGEDGGVARRVGVHRQLRHGVERGSRVLYGLVPAWKTMVGRGTAAVPGKFASWEPCLAEDTLAMAAVWCKGQPRSGQHCVAEDARALAAELRKGEAWRCASSFVLLWPSTAAGACPAPASHRVIAKVGQSRPGSTATECVGTVGHGSFAMA